MGEKSSWASYPSGVWVPMAAIRVLPTPLLGVQVRSVCPPDSRTYPAPPVAGIASFLHITLRWLRGTTKPSKPLFCGSSEAVIFHFSFSSFREAVRECMMKQK